MDVSRAQAEIRRSYHGGGPGMVVSGTVWLIAAITISRFGIATGFTVLFLGGMLIFPISSMVELFLFRRAKPTPDNPLVPLGLEATIAMIGCLFAAWLILPHDPRLVFPIAAIAVGLHYLAFKTLYGDRTYWLLGAAIAIAGLAGIYLPALSAMNLAIAVALIEIGFGIQVTARER